MKLEKCKKPDICAEDDKIEDFIKNLIITRELRQPTMTYDLDNNL